MPNGRHYRSTLRGSPLQFLHCEAADEARGSLQVRGGLLITIEGNLYISRAASRIAEGGDIHIESLSRYDALWGVFMLKAIPPAAAGSLSLSTSRSLAPIRSPRRLAHGRFSRRGFISCITGERKPGASDSGSWSPRVQGIRRCERELVLETSRSIRCGVGMREQDLSASVQDDT